MDHSTRTRRAACTIVARNYLAQARVLARSYLEHEPAGRLYVLVVDGLPEGQTEGDGVGGGPRLEPGVTLLTPDDLGIGQTDFLEMAFRYDVTELSTAVKPFLMRTLLQSGDLDQLVYFDPDIMIFRPLDEMWQLLERSNVVLIPHLLAPIPLDGLRPSEQDILVSGAYNLGFIGVRASDEVTRLLTWWAERLREHCRIDIAHGLFVDQKWIDLVPSLFSGVAILRDDTYDVAYWNLPSRTLVRHADGMLVNGRPITFFHYSGFHPDRPRVLSKHQDRLGVEDGTALAALLDQYTRALQDAGFMLSSRVPYGYGAFDNGARISLVHRHLYASLDPGQRRALGDPFKTSGPSSFFQWSGRPSTDARSGGLSPFLEQLLVESPDARFAFPDARDKQQKAFLTWAQTWGAEGFGYDPRLADPASWAATAAAMQPAAPDQADRADQTDRGINVIGYLRNETGLGAAARGFIRGLRGVGIPLGLRDLAELSPNRSQDTTLVDVDGQTPYGINLVVVNADQHFVVKSHLGEATFNGHYNIGYWSWELPTFPTEWLDRFAEYDEVWTPSSFIANALTPVSHIPVLRMPPVLTAPPGGSRAAGREHIGVADDTYVFLFVFDFASYFERKNPGAAIQAFTRAFDATDNVRLVIKCVNEHLDPAAFASLKTLAGDHPVSIHQGYWTADEVRDLMLACDAYVSLHRSEGLGHTIAEAMAHQKPVIATGWSGNMDFMNVANSFPVAFELVTLTHDVGPYAAGSVWAEPSIDDAQRLMRLVYDDRELSQARGTVAQRDIETHYSTRAVGQRLQQRLAFVMDRYRTPSRVVQAAVPERAAPAAPAPPRPSVPPMDLGRSSHGTVGVLVKRGMDFLLRYHTHYQGEINLEFASFMRQLSARQDAQAADDATTRRHMARLEQQLEATNSALYSVRQQLAEHDANFSGRPYMATDVYGMQDLGSPMGFDTNAAASSSSSSDGAEAPDFADLFRGARDFIADRQRVYLPFFKDRPRVVDLGSGRGEFLELLREQGISAVGVELDPNMVEQCVRRGLRVEHADALDYLAGLPAQSLDVIFSAQFIEHVLPDQLPRFLELARSRLRAGGLFIAETVNPESHLALKTFHVDLTHQRPIFPQVLLQLVQAAGYVRGRIFYPTAGGFTQAHYRTAGEYAVIAES